jgi:hypothetical protein
MDSHLFDEFASGYAIFNELDDFGPAVNINIQTGEPLFAETCERFAAWLLNVASILRQRKLNPETTVVYAITDGSMHKVGKAVSLQKRMKQLQTGNASQLRVVCFCRVRDDREAYELESAVHKSLRKYRVAGEWFSCNSHMVFDAIYQDADAIGVRQRPMNICVGHEDEQEAEYGTRP